MAQVLNSHYSGDREIQGLLGVDFEAQSMEYPGVYKKGRMQLTGTGDRIVKEEWV